MSVYATSAVWELAEAGALAANETLLLLALADYSGRDGTCYPGQNTLARRCCVSDRAIRKTLKGLVDRGLVEVYVRPGSGGGRKSNLYRLRLVAGQPEAECRLPGGQPELFDRATGTGVPGATGTEVPIEPSVLNRKKEPSAAAASATEEFDQFWEQYPKKVDKQIARKAWTKAVKTTTPARIMQGLQTYLANLEANGTTRQYTKNPATWLNNECWENEDDARTAPYQGNGLRRFTTAAAEPISF